MATREEKIAFLQSQAQSAPVAAPTGAPKTREEKIAFLQAAHGAAPASPAEAPSDMTGAAIEGFGQGASLGYLPQLQAAASKPIYAALNAITGNDVQPDSYVQERDANIARQEALKKSNPYTYGAGEVGGGIVTGIATSGLMPAPAATIGGRIAQAAKAGAVMGAVANPGDKAGVIDTTGQAPERIMNSGKGMALGTLLGTLVESPGIVKNGANAVKNKIAEKLGANVDYTPIANKDSVVNAAGQLGLGEKDIPKGVLTDNPTYQKLESGLSQSGSMPAKSIRDQYGKLFKALDEAGGKIDALKTTDSDFGIGSKIGKDLSSQVEKNTAPVAEMYNELNPLLQKIPVDKGAVNTQFGALKRNPLFQTKDGIAMLEDQKAAIQSMPELASLKEFRSTLHDSLGNNSSPLDEKRINAIYDAATKIRDNSIGATKAQFPKSVHGEVDALSNQIALADAAHASNLEDINSVKALVGNKEFSSPRAFLNKIGDMKEADLAAKASNLDVSTWQNLKDKFPTVFEKAKTAKVNDMIQSSTNPVSGFNDARFLKQWDGMDQEMKNLIFDPKMQAHIDAFRTVKQAIPDKLGPSGTPEGQMLMQMFSPKRTALDYGIKKSLEASANGSVASSAAQTATGAAAKAAVVGNSVTARPAYSGSARPAFERAPIKGETKWANDGFDKLKEHDRNPASLTDADKQKLMADPQGKQLLINASDLKPGSKAMDKQLERIRERLK